MEDTTINQSDQPEQPQPGEAFNQESSPSDTSDTTPAEEAAPPPADDPEPPKEEPEPQQVKRKAKYGEIAKIIVKAKWLERPAKEIAADIYSKYHLLQPNGSIPDEQAVHNIKSQIRKKQKSSQKDKKGAKHQKSSPRYDKSDESELSSRSEASLSIRFDRTDRFALLPMLHRKHPKRPPRIKFSTTVDPNLMTLFNSDMAERMLTDQSVLLDLILWNYYGQPALSYPSDKADTSDLDKYAHGNPSIPIRDTATTGRKRRKPRK